MKMVYKGGKDNRSPSCIFIGNLPEKVDEHDIRDLFDKFGEIREIDIKRGRTTNYTSYAFIEYAEQEAARDAVASRDGYEFERLRLRVEMAGEGRPHTHRRDDRHGERDRPKRTNYRIVVSSLPRGCRWQHLKDHMRKAGKVGYVSVDGDRGYVDFIHKSDLKYALDKLDGSTIETGEDSCRIKIRRDKYSRSYSRSRSYSNRRRRRSVSRSRSRHRPSPSVSRLDEFQDVSSDKEKGR